MTDDAKHTIAKVDEDRQLVFGWANVSMWSDGGQVVDSHGDMIDPDELENAAYEFALFYRETDEMHTEEVRGRMVESFVATPEKLVAMGLGADALPTGWWIGFKIDDPEVFAKVKSGEYRMFSIYGKALRVPA